MSPTTAEPREVLLLLARHWRRWLIPAIVVGAIAAIFSVVKSPTWQASQALIVRNEAANAETAPGKFVRSEEMKTVQETILELAKSRNVLAKALEEVGPPAASTDTVAWPTESDIDDLRDCVKFTPPKGAEFGATEVFYLQVRQDDRDRALLLTAAICSQLESRFQHLRDAKAQSMVDELEKAAGLAKADLDRATAQLSTIEKRVGSDLAELRMLQDGTAGESSIRRSVTEIENELRQTRNAQKGNEQLLSLLRAAQDDQGRLLATPNRLLESEPALKRLKDGLVDAQLRTATLEGRMSETHPLVEAAREAETQIGRHLHNELAISIRGLEAERGMNAARAGLLEEQLAKANGRLVRLAELRAPYANQAAEMNHRSKLVEKAQQSLAEARAARASANAANLISRIDTPDAGIRPVGPSRAMITLAGLAGGLILGLGVVLLTVQPAQPAKAAEANVATVQPPALPTPVWNDNSRSGFPTGNLSLKQALAKIASGN